MASKSGNSYRAGATLAQVVPNLLHRHRDEQGHIGGEVIEALEPFGHCSSSHSRVGQSLHLTADPSPQPTRAGERRDHRDDDCCHEQSQRLPAAQHAL